jgi:hypothetical protein
MAQINSAGETVSAQALPALLQKDLQQGLKNETLPQPRLYALIDMGHIKEGTALHKAVTKKLTGLDRCSLMDDDPRFEDFKPSSAWLVYGTHAALLDQFGDSDIISAWIVSYLALQTLAGHFKRAGFAYNEQDERFLLRYYDPWVTPVLRHLADKKWVEWFWAPFIAYWYPVATPLEETWRRIAGGAKTDAPEHIKLILTDELLEGLKHDPYTHRLLNFAQDKLSPSVFSSTCYGVRLAQIEELLEAARMRHGLKSKDDLTVYVLTMLNTPGIAEESRWQEAMRLAVKGEVGLGEYHSQV